MFERFTDRARRVVVLSQEEARLLNHNYIGTEHILLGLVHEGEGVAAQALTSVGIRLPAVRVQVEEIIGQGGSSPSGHIPFTPRSKRVLELALREALQLGHNYIGTEHILLGLIREGEGVAAQVLVKLGADLSGVRERIIQLLAGHAGPSGAAGESTVGLDVADQAASMRLAARAAASGVVFPRRGEMLARSLDRIVFRRFTVSACRVLLLAESEALRLGQATTGVEHLLLGLLAEEEGEAARALAALGVDLGRGREIAEHFLAPSAAPLAQEPVYGDDVLDAIELALHEAFLTGSGQINTEHLLLGVVHQADNVAGGARQALDLLGTSSDAVRRALGDVETSPEPSGESDVEDTGVETPPEPSGEPYVTGPSADPVGQDDDGGAAEDDHGSDI